MTQTSAFLSNNSVYKLGPATSLNETFGYFFLSFVFIIAFNLPTFAKGALDINRKIVVQVMLKIHVYEVRT